MKQEEKELLLKDLCARLPYGIIASVRGSDEEFQHFHILGVKDGKVWVKNDILQVDHFDDVEVIKPYLRPMSSMTEEEKEEFKRICDEEDILDECGYIVGTFYGMKVLYGEVEDVYPYNLKIKIPQNLNYSVLDFLNAHYLDYRGLIEKGLALEAPEGMYKTE